MNSSPKKILIISNFFYPENTPRAFRTTELVKGFSKKGHNITLIIPNKEIYKDNLFYAEGLSIIFGDGPLKKNVVNNNNNLQNLNILQRIRKKINQIGRYFLPRELFLTYDNGITSAMSKLNDNFDLIISISQPLSIHFSYIFSKFRKTQLKKECTSVAEFSDPLFKGEKWSIFPIYWLLGYVFSASFDKFSIPTSNSLTHFSKFKNKKNIIVIPQGFDFSDININNYTQNNPPIFAYAGRFYHKLREPIYFFQYLTTINIDFRFILYIPADPVSDKIINIYQPLLKNRLIVKNIIPRNELIYELSSFDFLINFENENTQMVPSKLIDYCLTKRPILSFNSKTFSENKIIKFLHGNYENQILIDLNNYDIKKIVADFCSLCK